MRDYVVERCLRSTGSLGVRAVVAQLVALGERGLVTLHWNEPADTVVAELVAGHPDDAALAGSERQLVRLLWPDGRGGPVELGRHAYPGHRIELQSWARRRLRTAGLLVPAPLSGVSAAIVGAGAAIVAVGVALDLDPAHSDADAWVALLVGIGFAASAWLTLHLAGRRWSVTEDGLRVRSRLRSAPASGRTPSLAETIAAGIQLDAWTGLKEPAPPPWLTGVPWGDDPEERHAGVGGVLAVLTAAFH